jgi:hypothetical protein
MSQRIEEVWRREKDIREFIIEADKELKCVDIGFFSAVPSIYDEHPKYDFLIVSNVDIAQIDGLQYRVVVEYQPRWNNPIRKEVISIQPGDVIVLTCPEGYNMSEKNGKRLKETLLDAFPNNTSLVLVNGVTLEVYREQAKDN